jgi:hypothetical protein
MDEGRGRDALTPPGAVASVPGVMGKPVTDTGSAPAAPRRGERLRARVSRASRAIEPAPGRRTVPRPATALVTALAVIPFAAVGAAAEPVAGPAPGAVTAVSCLTAGNNAYLRARLRGTLDLDLAWSSPAMQCEGGARPDGRGLRVTIAGPAQADGRRLRFVFGIDDAPEGARVLARPTNLTVIFEGEQRLFATRGNDRCTTDELRPERIGALGGARRSWRVVARGFCISPATTLAGDARLLVTSFDFASEVTYEDDPAPAPSGGTATAARP